MRGEMRKMMCVVGGLGVVEMFWWLCWEGADCGAGM